MAKMQIPSCGRVIHYVLKQGRSAGQTRPAMVVRQSTDLTNPKASINCLVYLDGINDVDNEFASLQVGSAFSVTFDPSGKTPGSWSWPPFIAPVDVPDAEPEADTETEEANQ